MSDIDKPGHQLDGSPSNDQSSNQDIVSNTTGNVSANAFNHDKPLAVNTEADKKQPLSQSRILSAGLAIVAERGVDAVTFRNLAKDLSVTPMALYRHFDDKDALLAEMLNEMIRQSEVCPQDDLLWDEWLRQLVNNMYNVLCGNVSWIPVFRYIQLKPAGLQVIDTALGVLLAEGFNKQESVNALITLFQTVLGASAMFSQDRLSMLPPNIDLLDEHPQLLACLNELAAIRLEAKPNIDWIIDSLKMIKNK